MSQTDDSKRQYNTKQIKKVLIITFLLNLLVCVAKITYGSLTQSLSLTADGFHSLFDASSNIVGFVAVMLAFKPADEGHPYGHLKMESFASLGIAFLLFITCFELISDVSTRIQHPVTPEINLMSFVIMVSTMVINYVVARYEAKKGHELKSDFLLADSVHTRMDFFVSLSVIISFVSVLFHWPQLDIIMACVIILFIIYAAFKIIYQNFNILLDAQTIDPNEIEKVVLSISGIDLCHKIRSRGTQHGIFIDLHIHVHPLMTTEDSHRLTHQVIRTIKHRFPEVLDVLIHTEPSFLTKPHET